MIFMWPLLVTSMERKPQTSMDAALKNQIVKSVKKHFVVTLPNPRHDDDETGWDVGVKEVVTETTFELENDLQTRELACKNTSN